MRLRFLGTGTSSGVPLIGCRCDVCLSTDPRDRRLRTSATLEFTDHAGQPRVILIDAGPDLREQALAAGLDRVDAILLTHSHVDHTWGLDEVRRFNAVMGQAVDLYAERHVLDRMTQIYQHIFEPQRNVQPSFVASLIPRALEPESTFYLHGLRITPIRLLHGRLPVLGFRFERERPDPSADSGDPVLPLAYCTDVSAIPPQSWEALADLRVLVLDALRSRHHPTHFTLDQALHVAERVAAERTYFIHMSHDLPHEATQAQLPDGVQLAHDGLTVG